MISPLHLAIFGYAVAILTAFAAFRLSHTPAYSTRRIRFLGAVYAFMGLTQIVGGGYRTLQARTPETILDVVGGLTFFVASGAAFYSARKRATLEGEITVS